MKRTMTLGVCAAILSFTGAGYLAYGAQAVPRGIAQLTVGAAERSDGATQVQLLGATQAGRRLVAVGDHGVVLLSDDDGNTYRQARSVPADVTLTSVSFIDDSHGWAVGHWGVILRTSDGGETWSLQHTDTTVDRPLFSVYFRNINDGWAVGLWSLIMHTDDGGKTWVRVKMPPPPGSSKVERNLNWIFADSKGSLFIACEQGRVMRSTDSGRTWTYAETGYEGSFWTGVALRDGTLLVGGLQGKIYRSVDGGQTWNQAMSPFKSSVTDLVQTGAGDVVGSALDGVVLTSNDDGKTFSGRQKSNRTALTAVVRTASGNPIFFSASGVVKE